MILLRRLQGYWLMTHPFPIAMVVAFAGMLAIATAHDALDLTRFARAIATLFCSQVVVGVSNDYHDRALDAQGQPWKPLARGIVTPNEARVIIFLAFALMLGFALSLGSAIVALALIGTFAGLLYNFWLRGTPFSWLPYVIGFITLPIFVWVSIERFDARQIALVPIGLPLLLAVHLAQTLPDSESDRALGGRGLAVTLGRPRGVAAMWLLCFVAQTLALIVALMFNSDLQIIGASSSLAFALVVASIVMYRRNPTAATLRAIFRLIAPSAVILIAGWLFALKPVGS